MGKRRPCLIMTQWYHIYTWGAILVINYNRGNILMNKDHKGLHLSIRLQDITWKLQYYNSQKDYRNKEFHFMHHLLNLYWGEYLTNKLCEGMNSRQHVLCSSTEWDGRRKEQACITSCKTRLLSMQAQKHCLFEFVLMRLYPINWLTSHYQGRHTQVEVLS